MKVAKCTSDERTYTTLDFSKLPPSEMATKRKRLVCPECGAPVFFRKASRDGQSAFFGALAHHQGCSLFLIDNHGLESGQTNELEYRLGDSTKSSPDINILTSAEKALAEIIDNTALADSIQTVERSKPSLQIRPALKDLLEGLALIEFFNRQDQTPENEQVFFDVKKSLLLNFSDLDQGISTVPLGYWGMLTDARLSSEGALWLNTGGTDDLSCVIDNSMVDHFYKRYKLDDEESLAGAYAIIIGRLQTSQRGKKYIKLESLDFIELLNPTPHSSLKNRFFISEKKELAFFLQNNIKGVFDEQLGIKRKHYIDKKVAQEWRAKLSSQFHPDRNNDDESFDFEEITAHINKMYNRMVGKA